MTAHRIEGNPGIPEPCYCHGEKLHAYTRTYAADRPSSRVKDLVDAFENATFIEIGQTSVVIHDDL